MNHPDPKKHFNISMIKSAARILACAGAVIAASDGLIILGLGLLLAEIIGIVEELV
jgi:hypothetical protein